MPQISPTLFEDSLVDALPLAACICEAPSGLIIRSNAHAAALWGQKPEPDTRIHDVLRFVHPDGAPLPLEAFPLATAIADGTADANRQGVIERRGQSSVLVSINILPLSTLGQRRAGLLLFHNASERHLSREAVLKGRDRTDESLRFERSRRNDLTGAFLDIERNATNEDLIDERAHADSVTASQEDFLADVSHDLRSLLGGLAVSASLLIADAVPGKDGDKIRRHAGASHRAVVQMTRLLNDLLDTASIEAGKLAIVAGRVDAGRLISDTVEALTSMAAAKNITLNGVVPAPPLAVTGDDLRILQVLENLVTNAIKFTPAGGRVSIRTRATARRIQFVVSDTGIGMPEDKLAIIFERFHQVSKDRRGLGLGLHISKSIVEAHGGRIWAKSEVAIGSTFYVELPLAPVGGSGKVYSQSA